METVSMGVNLLIKLLKSFLFIVSFAAFSLELDAD